MKNRDYLTIDDDCQGDCVGYIGGVPRLPEDMAVPKCGLCGVEQTFFFLIRFPKGHAWEGRTISTFACTNCANEDWLIPEMASAELLGAFVSEEFLSQYERNFRIVVFSTADEKDVTGTEVHIARKEVRLSHSESRPTNAFGQLGGTPQWLLGDETPLSVEGETAIFLMQVFQGFEYATEPDAPAQIELGLDGTPEAGPPGAYRIFLANELYMFGAKQRAHRVYAFTQLD